MSSEETVRLLTHVVAPAGTGIWAFTQAGQATEPAVGWGLLALAAGGLFLAFRSTINIADDRLNGGAA